MNSEFFLGGDITGEPGSKAAKTSSSDKDDPKKSKERNDTKAEDIMVCYFEIDVW